MAFAMLTSPPPHKKKKANDPQKPPMFQKKNPLHQDVAESSCFKVLDTPTLIS